MTYVDRDASPSTIVTVTRPPRPISIRSTKPRVVAMGSSWRFGRAGTAESAFVGLRQGWSGRGVDPVSCRSPKLRPSRRMERLPGRTKPWSEMVIASRQHATCAIPTTTLGMGATSWVSASAVCWASWPADRVDEALHDREHDPADDRDQDVEQDVAAALADVEVAGARLQREAGTSRRASCRWLHSMNTGPLKETLGSASSRCARPRRQ